MNNTPKVSILVPIYGVERFIERCAISLFEQSYDNIEYIFVNDCTKDNSITILKKVIERYPQRKPQVQIIEHETNKGLAGARNTAVAAATGEFLMHVDSDDYVDNKIVSKAVDKQMESNADVVIIDFCMITSEFKKIFSYSTFSEQAEYCLAVLKRKNPHSIWAKLIRRSLYVNNDVKCSEGNNQGEDMQVVPVLLYYAKKIINLKEPLYFYDSSNDSSYCSSFSINKHNQNWNSINIVKSFFYDKGTVYKYAVDSGCIRQIADDFIISVKSNGEVSHYYYNYAKSILKEIDKRCWSELPKFKRLILLFSNHYFLMKAYILEMRWLRHSFLRIKEVLSCKNIYNGKQKK